MPYRGVRKLTSFCGCGPYQERQSNTSASNFLTYCEKAHPATPRKFTEQSEHEAQEVILQEVTAFAMVYVACTPRLLQCGHRSGSTDVRTRTLDPPIGTTCYGRVYKLRIPVLLVLATWHTSLIEHPNWAVPGAQF